MVRGPADGDHLDATVARDLQHCRSDSPRRTTGQQRLSRLHADLADDTERRLHHAGVAIATTYGEGWVERVRQLGHVDAALDLAGSGVIRELVELTGDPQKVISIADLGAPELGVRFSGDPGGVPEALVEAASLISQRKLHIPVEKSYTLAEAAAAHTDSQAGHTRDRRVVAV